MIHNLLHFVELPFDFIERVEEAPGGDRRPHQREAEDIPSKHVPPAGIRAVNAEVNGLCLQLFCNPSPSGM